MYLWITRTKKNEMPINKGKIDVEMWKKCGKFLYIFKDTNF